MLDKALEIPHEVTLVGVGALREWSPSCTNKATIVLAAFVAQHVVVPSAPNDLQGFKQDLANFPLGLSDLSLMPCDACHGRNRVAPTPAWSGTCL